MDENYGDAEDRSSDGVRKGDGFNFEGCLSRETLNGHRQIEEFPEPETDWKDDTSG